jgi:hypothetical protein
MRTLILKLGAEIVWVTAANNVLNRLLEAPVPGQLHPVSTDLQVVLERRQ